MHPILLVVLVPKIIAAKSQQRSSSDFKDDAGCMAAEGASGEILKIVAVHWFQKWNSVTMPV